MENPVTGLFEKHNNFGWVDYSMHIRPVCLPCMGSNAMVGFLANSGILRGDETQEERCELESTFLIEIRLRLQQR